MLGRDLRIGHIANDQTLEPGFGIPALSTKPKELTHNLESAGLNSHRSLAARAALHTCLREGMANAPEMQCVILLFWALPAIR